ncbi:hypothetical protein D3C84_594400 [compost metagenome]
MIPSPSAPRVAAQGGEDHRVIGRPGSAGVLHGLLLPALVRFMPVPAFLVKAEEGFKVLETDLPGCASALWLLTRPDCRALRSVTTLFEELGKHVRLPGSASQSG